MSNTIVVTGGAGLIGSNIVAALNERVQNNAKKHEVEATPTFEINGKKMEPGYHSLAEIDAAIENAGN